MKMLSRPALVLTLIATSLLACSAEMEPAKPTLSSAVPTKDLRARPPKELAELKPRVLFKSNREMTVSWYTMKPDGSQIQPLELLIDGEIKMVTWVHELRSFAAILNLDGQFDLYLVDHNGQVGRRLTSTPDAEGWPSYSDSAKAFAFPCVRSDLDICTVGSTGGDIMNLTGYPSREDAPDWSPSGRKIIFVSNRDAVPDVWMVSNDGSDLTNLTNTGQPDAAPSWAPDGESILFTSQRDQNSEIYIMGPDGNSPINLTNHPATDVAPQWSPDGSYIAFRSDRTGDEEIYTMTADGTNVTNVTMSPESDEYVFSWALDGQSVLYTSDADGDTDIFGVDRDGKNRRNLTNSSFDDFAPQWIYN